MAGRTRVGRTPAERRQTDRRRRLLLRLALLGGVGLVVLVACNPTWAFERGGRVVLAHTWTSPGLDALVAGEIAVNERGCYGIAGDGGSVTTVIWPSGTHATRDGAIRTLLGQVLHEGDRIEGGGGWLDFRDTHPRLAERCLTADDGPGTEVIVLDKVHEAGG